MKTHDKLIAIINELVEENIHAIKNSRAYSETKFEYPVETSTLFGKQKLNAVLLWNESKFGAKEAVFRDGKLVCEEFTEFKDLEDYKKIKLAFPIYNFLNEFDEYLSELAAKHA